MSKQLHVVCYVHNMGKINFISERSELAYRSSVRWKSVTYLLYDCLSYFILICQLEGDIFPYCPLVIARTYSDTTLLAMQKPYNKLIVIPRVGQYVEIFRSLRSGRCGP